ncbi:MAG: acyltransferase [Marinilabiliaceae bacterium]|nr:acyltransferase [Marinilabiliaceae bacterium]
MIRKLLNFSFRVLIRITYGKARIFFLRQMGVKIGENCLVFYADFSTEPYLIELGNHVTVSTGVRFITHDGAVWLFRQEYPDLDIFGPIKIGNNSCIGMNSILLPNTQIGENCIVAAGAVVKGRFPDNSLIIGNPAKRVLDTRMQKRLYMMSPSKFNMKRLNNRKKKKVLLDRFFNEKSSNLEHTKTMSQTEIN